MGRNLLFYFLIILSLFIFNNCGVNRVVSLEDEMIKEANAVILEEATQEACAQITTIPILKTEHNLVVMSAEQVEDRDYPNLALVEDAIISALTKAGYNVLERDNDILIRILYQEGKNEITSVVVPPTTSQLDEREESTQLPKYNLDYGKKVQIISSKVNPEVGSENIKPADYIISYRIVEQGVKYSKSLEADEYGIGQIKRKAYTKLHIRIIDAKTSQIVWANNIEGSKEDFVPKWMVKKLEETGYQFYSQSLPLVNQR
ncbi:MAG TPA: CsgG/HfaB family protein [bacterium]|nr:CsgG/HfaB family protein [bacterium]HOL47000.1 CsgG/HfaB family protein [bacterium]HPQ19004.1 CsgG/HfaB family protein [bacterium]